MQAGISKRDGDGIVIDCAHWSDCGVGGGGCCSLNPIVGGRHVGPRPSFGVCNLCTHNKARGSDIAAAVALAAAKPWGPAAWRQLHLRPLTCDLAREDYWLSHQMPMQCGECSREWGKLLRESPPDLSSRLAYARWTWMAHNAVNQRLGKPEFVWDEAVKLYGWENLSTKDPWA